MSDPEFFLEVKPSRPSWYAELDRAGCQALDSRQKDWQEIVDMFSVKEIMDATNGMLRCECWPAQILRVIREGRIDSVLRLHKWLVLEPHERRYFADWINRVTEEGSSRTLAKVKGYAREWMTWQEFRAGVRVLFQITNGRGNTAWGLYDEHPGQINKLPPADQLRLAAWILRGQRKQVGHKPRQAPSIRPDRLRQSAQERAAESPAISGTVRLLREGEILAALRGTDLWRYA